MLRLLLLLWAQVSIVTLLAAMEADDAYITVDLLRSEDLVELGLLNLFFLAISLLVPVLAAVVADDRLPLLLLGGSAVVVCHRAASVVSGGCVGLFWRPVLRVREVSQLLERRYLIDNH